MSIVAFKKKGIIQFGSNISGNKGLGGGGGGGGSWLNQGPFGPKGHIGGEIGPGFSINGGIRSGTYIGKNMSMSKNGTPFRGIHARGSGGVRGRYPKAEPTMNAGIAYIDITGNQAKFIKQSSLSTNGMLEKKYMWINNGQYPNNWVQPDGNLPYNFSQWLYIQKKAAANDCVTDVNTPEKYIGHIKACTATNYPLSRTTYNTKAANGAYTKNIHVAQTASQYTLRVQKRCANPLGPQKPFPFAANNGSEASSGSTNYKPPPISTPTYSSPPAWYTA